MVNGHPGFCCVERPPVCPVVKDFVPMYGVGMVAPCEVNKVLRLTSTNAKNQQNFLNIIESLRFFCYTVSR